MAPDAEEAITGARTEKNDRDSGDEVRERKKRVLVSAMKLNRTESSPFDESYTALLPNPSLPTERQRKSATGSAGYHSLAWTREKGDGVVLLFTGCAVLLTRWSSPSGNGGKFIALHGGWGEFSGDCGEFVCQIHRAETYGDLFPAMSRVRDHMQRNALISIRIAGSSRPSVQYPYLSGWDAWQ
ncbi:hypothetical protein AXG93_1052s1110 [Marchantia polymorpha subsp. ruderalis]|uniref:Uncharacterized protein n=1 Tax=Marchantia polymorpha subsp. ruderalis TaxID=1480154 RepID=A0A176VU18_MARPO|nr:hypothetical protein AXG93_1052s1110 [Marchantia polymorpha subsp. ruderalis]